MEEGDSAWVDETDDMDTSDAADTIASDCSGDQASPLSLDPDLRPRCPKVVERGLKTRGDAFDTDGSLTCDDGDPESFMPRAFVKLHFFEGVLNTAGADAVEIYPCE